MTTNESCSNCRYCRNDSCHRHGPQVVVATATGSTTGYHPVWAVVAPVEWCGDYEKKNGSVTTADPLSAATTSQHSTKKKGRNE
jgi:hypothetical protein